MTDEHLSALLTAAEAKKEEKAFTLNEGRLLTLYVANSGANLTVSKVQAVRIDKGLVHARTSRGEHYVLALTDCYAGSIEAPPSGARKAGFV